MTIGIIKGNTIVGIKEEATAATATVQVTNDTFDGGEILNVNGVALTEGVDWASGSGVNTTATAIASAINDSNNLLINGVLTAVAVTDTVTMTADNPGIEGNLLTLTESNVGATDNLTLSGALFTGGASTEGTAAAPSLVTDFVQVLEDGLEITPAKELIDRTILTSSIGKAQPRVSVKSATGSLPLEFRASGTEGDAPQYDVILRSLMGKKRRLRNRITSGSSHTANTLNVTDADEIFQVGDFIVVLESAAHFASFVASVSSTAITLATTATGSFTNAVEIAKSHTYFPRDINHPNYTTSVYWGDEILEQAIGGKSASMSIDSFTTGQISTLSFALDALSFNETNASAALTPSYDSVLPALVLNAKVVQDTTELDLNEFALSVENTVTPLTSVKSSDGRISSRITSRVASGTFNPYKDDTTVSNFTKFNQNTQFSLVVTFQNDSSSSGEFELGSICGVYLPNCIITEKAVGDEGGVLLENLSYSANTGAAGSTDEIFIGYS